MGVTGGRCSQGLVGTGSRSNGGTEQKQEIERVMRTTGIFAIISIMISVLYGVGFSTLYPRMEISDGIVSVIALLGIGTALLLLGIFKLISWCIRRRAN